MGTRASFWIGNPVNLEDREWLGCIAFDGYPDGLPELSHRFSTEELFRIGVEIIARREDFADPSGGWPFPWDTDIFLTDYTYAFFDGRIWVAHYHCEFVPFHNLLDDRVWEDMKDYPPHKNVPAGKEYDPDQPDSVMFFIRLDPRKE